MKKIILVTGGAGYIGSHMTRYLLDRKYQVIVFDNLSTGHRSFIPAEAIFVKGDLRNYPAVLKVFKKYKIDAVMNFAGLIVSSESCADPTTYYDNNVIGAIHLLKAMKETHVNCLIFSSSAAVYGNAHKGALHEGLSVEPMSPYAWTKLMFEQMIKDYAASHDQFSYVMLRYFNAAGAHASCVVGECHHPETHLIPNILRSIKNQKQALMVYGKNYPTKDGTCVRDYIHVDDLCEAHYLSLKGLLNHTIRREILNLGTGDGNSILDVIAEVEKVTGKKVSFKFAPPRLGDPPFLVASYKRAQKVLGWKPKKDLRSILTTAWVWEIEAKKCLK